MTFWRRATCESSRGNSEILSFTFFFFFLLVFSLFGCTSCYYFLLLKALSWFCLLLLSASTGLFSSALWLTYIQPKANP